VITPQPTALDAGTGLTVSGGTTSNSLRLEHAGQYLTGVSLASSYTFSGTGGNDVGAFSASVTVPSPALVWNEMTSLKSV
jgi:hypothetical protein